MAATTTDSRNVAIPSNAASEAYREFWAAHDHRPAPPMDAVAGRTVILFTQYRVFRLAPAEAVALAAQLRRAAQPELFTTCSRCGEFFETTDEYAANPGRVCGSCGDDLRQEADAERGAAEHEAAGPGEPNPDAGF